MNIYEVTIDWANDHSAGRTLVMVLAAAQVQAEAKARAWMSSAAKRIEVSATLAWVPSLSEGVETTVYVDAR